MITHSVCVAVGKFVCDVNGGKPVRSFFVYSCFDKGCPTKPYTTMPKGIMGNRFHGP